MYVEGFLSLNVTFVIKDTSCLPNCVSVSITCNVCQWSLRTSSRNITRTNVLRYPTECRFFVERIASCSCLQGTSRNKYIYTSFRLIVMPADIYTLLIHFISGCSNTFTNITVDWCITGWLPDDFDVRYSKLNLDSFKSEWRSHYTIRHWQ